MVDIVKKIFFFLRFSSNKKIYFFVLSNFILSFLEIIGLSMLIPVLIIFFQTDGGFSNEYLILFSKFIIQNIQLNLIILIIFLIFLFKSIFFLFLTNWKIKFLNNISLSISNKLLNRYMYEDQEIYFKRNSAEFIRNVTNENRRVLKLLTAAADLFIDLTLLTIIILFLFFVSFKPTMMIMAVLTLFSLLYFFSIKNFLLNLGQRSITLTGDATKFLIECFKGFTEIFINNKQNFFISRFIFKDKSILKIKRYEGVIKFLPRVILELLVVSIILISLWFFTKKTQNLNDVFFMISIYGSIFFRVYPAVGKSIANFQTIISCKPSLSLLEKEINAELKNIRFVESQNKVEEIKIDNIFFNNLSFYYDEETPLIRNLTKKIQNNSLIGISGKSGAGKTTLILLLSGILRPKNGEILINDNKIETIPNLFDIIAYVSQKPFLIDGSIRDNVCIGTNETNLNKNQLAEVYNQSGLTEFISQLSLKDKTNVGDSGSLLSGGQIQRIGIARALYKKSKILLLDEITSNLDEKIKIEIINNLKFIKKNKIIILISHDKNILDKCDDIISL